jgi:hypothetical protein
MIKISLVIDRKLPLMLVNILFKFLRKNNAII